MHDQNFKNLILDYPQQALEFFAAEEVQDDLSQARIVPLRQEQLQERLGERFRELDIPLLVEWPDGRREGLLFVIEEETETSRFAIHRLAHYCLDLAELLNTERVVPVVIFLRSGSRPDRLRLGGDRATYLDFRYLACDLYALPAEDYQDSENLVARLALPTMDYSGEARLAVYAAAQIGLIQLESDPNRRSKYVDFIDYYANLSDEEQARYRATYVNERGEIMGFAQYYRAEGEQLGIKKGIVIGQEQGIEKGIEKGIPQGEAQILRRQLTRRFGPLPEWVETKLTESSTEQLEHWADRILEAESLDAVFQDPV
jgi:hypothetical protein